MRLGINIGTHTARAAYLDEAGQPQLVKLANGATTLPVVARQTMHGLVVGQSAAQTLAGNAETTICSPTRLMGYAGLLPEAVCHRLPYPIRQLDGEVLCNLLYAEVSASEVYGHLVQTLIQAAETQQKTPVESVVLTVPASAEDRFRVQARNAVENVGIKVQRLLNQPTAALLAANLPSTEEHVAVIHCGGGSTDVSIAHYSPTDIRILATAGDMLLGGDDLAWQVAENLNQRFQQTAGVNVFQVDRSQVARFGLKLAAENALHTLALAPKMTLAIDHGAGFGRDLMTVVHRQEVTHWLTPLLKKLTDLCHRALSASQLTAQQIDTIVLTGDWSGLPAVQETIATAFQKPVGRLQTGKAMLLPVYGAALATRKTARFIWDVTPYPLGINCYYNNVELFSPIIAANNPIPTPPIGDKAALTQSYETYKPNQTEVKLDILQYRGSRPASPHQSNPVTPNECEHLGSWTFRGLRPKKGRRAPFTVTFAVDEDGILHLYAKETKTGHSLQTSINRGIYG